MNPQPAMHDEQRQGPPQPRLTRGRVSLRPSTPDDCQFVLGVESHPENAEHVGQWPPERHMACMSSADSVHWIVEGDGRRIGYAVLEDADDPNHSLLLRRIAIAGKGRGYGSGALRLVARYCFEVLEFHRLWLYVAVDNRRAYRWYRKLGFQQEGIARDCDRTKDGYRSMYILSMLEGEYREKMRKKPAGASPQPGS
jgi:RimJ/RimL family protein N-acetyltransferase